MKRSGGRRYYRPDDVDLLRGIRRLLYGEGYTIRGVQRILKEQGIRAVQALVDGAATLPAPGALRSEAGPREIEAEADELVDDDGAEEEEAAAPAPAPARAGPAAPPANRPAGAEARKPDRARLQAALQALV